MSLSKNNYKNIQNVSDDFALEWELNTLANIGSKHMELTRKATGGPAVIECGAFPTRYSNFQNEEGAAKFESDPLKQKFNAHFMQGPPTTLTLSTAQRDELLNEQEETIRVLLELDAMCVQFIWNSPGILEKKKKQCRAIIKKQSSSTSTEEIERLAYEMFADQAQSGLMLTDTNTYDIKTKMPAYRKNRQGEVVVRPPVLVHKNIAGVLEQVNYDEITVNRGALIVPHIRIKPYVTPNGAYGTTYTFVAGNLIVNGPSYGSSVEFSDYSDIYTVHDATDSEIPNAKRQKA